MINKLHIIIHSNYPLRESHRQNDDAPKGKPKTSAKNKCTD